ncbi:unnamed protein product [Pylaiella littoralis]
MTTSLAVLFLSVVATNLELAAGFLPTNVVKCRHQSYQSPSRRLWRARDGGTCVTLSATEAGINPPDDFIDTPAGDGPGSSFLAVDFERQELRVIFETMDRNNIFYKMLAEDQITEILQLAQALLSVKKMPQDISKLCQSSKMKGRWKLYFSTEERYKLLPPTADIYNYIYDTSPSPSGGGRGRLDNVIRFYKSWVVKSVRAVTRYEMDDRGKIFFEFDGIEADLLGFKVPLPKFNMDAGFVEVQYFDGDLWIEAFEADTTMTESGKTTVVNIYRRIGDATEDDKTNVPERTGEQRQPQR